MLHVCCWSNLRLFASGVRGDFRIRRFNSGWLTLSHLCKVLGLQCSQVVFGSVIGLRKWLCIRVWYPTATAANASFVRNACHSPISAGRQWFITFFLIFLSFYWEKINRKKISAQFYTKSYFSLFTAQSIFLILTRRDQMKSDSSEDNRKEFWYFLLVFFSFCKWCLSKSIECHTELASFQNKSNASLKLPRLLSSVSFQRHFLCDGIKNPNSINWQQGHIRIQDPTLALG